MLFVSSNWNEQTKGNCIMCCLFADKEKAGYYEVQGDRFVSD